MNPQDFQKNFIAMLSAMQGDHLSKSDFEAQFKKVLEMLIEMKKRFEAQAQTLSQTIKQAHDGSMGMITNKADTSVAESKKAMMAYCMTEMEKMMKEHEAKMMAMDAKMDSVIDGKDADESAMMVQMKSEMMQPMIDESTAKVETDLPKLGVSIRNGLELLQGDERLDVKAIKGLDEELKKVSDAIPAKGGGGRTWGGTGFHDLSAQTNGTLKVFSVPKGLSAILFSSDFPSVLMENRGFTLNL